MIYELLNIVVGLVGFLLFMLIQAIFINGVHESFKGGCVNDINKGKICSGMILYNLNPTFFERNKGTWWSKPLWSCVKCQSSFYGAITFWPTVLYFFGFNFFEIPIFIFNVFCLVSLNYFIYKKL